ncbi:MAG: hypothetical protein ACRD8O_05855 [Bryobacteraceae bacterium]
MDVEKTIEFLLQQQGRNEMEHARMMERTEAIMRIAEANTQNIARLDDVMATLAEAQIRTQERFMQTDDRIDKLVSAIGEFLRRNNGGQH